MQGTHMMSGEPRSASATQKGSVYACILLCMVLAWSWLFTVRIDKLSSSFITGYLCVLVVFVVIVGVSFVLFARAARYFLSEYNRQESLSPWFLVKLFLVWAALEWIVSVATAMIWMGPDGSWDTVFPLGSLTPMLMYTPLRFLARLIGFHGLSSLVVVLISVLSAKKLRRYAPVTIGLCLIALAAMWLSYRTAQGPVVQAVVVAEQLEIKVPPVQTTADLVVLPEYGLDSIDPLHISARLTSSSGKDTFFVGSQRSYINPTHTQNVLVFGSTQRGFIEQRPKSRLIPGGEYLPHILEAPLKLLRQDRPLAEFQLADAIAKGRPNNHVLRVNNQIALGSAACASIISPQDYRTFVRKGATVLTNSASLAPFNSPLFTLQHQGLARFMATANARPFLQSSNAANAFALDHDGQLLKTISPLQSAELTVRANTKKTPYTLVGEWPVYAGLLLMAASSVARLKKRIQPYLQSRRNP